MWKNIGKAGIWFAIYFGLQNIISTILAVAVIAKNIALMPDVTETEAFLDFIIDAVMTTAVPALAVSGVLMLIIYGLYRKKTHQSLDIKTLDWRKVILFVGFGFVLNMVTSLGVGIISEMLPSSWTDSLTQSVDLVTTGNFWLILLTTGIIVPIMEEITFRYGMHGSIAKSNVVWAYLISAVVFGLMHGNPIQIMYATLMGVVLSFVYEKTKNICYPMIIHMAVNSSSVSSMLFESEAAFVGSVIGAGTVLLIAGIVLCKNNAKNQAI